MLTSLYLLGTKLGVVATRLPFSAPVDLRGLRAGSRCYELARIAMLAAGQRKLLMMSVLSPHENQLPTWDCAFPPTVIPRRCSLVPMGVAEL